MRAATIILAVIFASGGLTALYAALTGAPWFFSTRSARSLTGRMSPRMARILYGLLGAAILAMALTLLLNPAPTT